MLELDRGPGLVDPGIGPSVVTGRRRPPRRRRDVADRDRDDPVGIEDLERVVWRVHAEPGHSILVALVVVRPDMDVTRRPGDGRPFQEADERDRKSVV